MVWIVVFPFSIFAQTKQAYLNSGSKAIEEGDYYTAGSYYKKALAFDEEDPSVLFKLADACRLYNDYESAVLWYTKYAELKGTDKKPLSVFYLAEMNKQMGRYALAKKYYQEYSSLYILDSNFFSIKSAHEISACDTALRLRRDTTNVVVINAGNNFNTIYSDFGAQQLADSVVYFSSQRFSDKPNNRKEKPSYISRILKSKQENSQWQVPFSIDRLFNPSSFLNCNSSISADHKLFVFSRCTPINQSTYHADLMLSKWEHNKWQNPIKLGKEVNDKTFTTTQPCLATNGAMGYVLYFSSDRPGGFGGMDLWKCNLTNGQFGEPVNLGAYINTKGDEVTPFFDNLNSVLYFSSNWHAGLGGYDIFKSVVIGNMFSAPVNLGYPTNSSCHDLYFTVQKDAKEGWLTSNRPGSMYIHSQTCCYDLYRFSISEPIQMASDNASGMDSTTINLSLKRVADSLTLLSLLPLKLYFDNDEPGKRSTDTMVNVSYEETYAAYLDRKPDYLNAFKNNTDSMQYIVDYFFESTVEGCYWNLEKFTRLLIDQLLDGRKITLTLQGCASPLSKADYNRKLSLRRISSMVNYLKKYDNGKLLTYFESNKLIIVSDGAGETLSQKQVSDNYHDKKKSVYHPDAALERRIEVTAIKFE